MRLRLLAFVVLWGFAGGAGCAHAGAMPACPVWPLDGKAWQLDRVEPPWAIFIGVEDEVLHISRHCLGEISEGMIVLDGERQYAKERELAMRIRESLIRLSQQSLSRNP